MAIRFDYHSAFSRNIGWVTSHEQAILRSKRVAIAGMGGVGGSHLLTLTRLGIGAFHIADFDSFDIANFNRQVGATITHIGQAKVDVLAEMALDINPGLEIIRFPDGITNGNLEQFLAGVDIYIDGLDFFAFNARKAVFAACHEQGIPAVTAAPLGMGAALLNFLPGGMTFDKYFCLDGYPEAEQGLRFLLGLAPAALHRNYLVDPKTIDLEQHRGPSTAIGCELCAGVAAAEAIKILLGRGKVYSAPHGLQFDAYRNKWVHTWRPGGNQNPLQRLSLTIARRHFLNAQKQVNLTMQANKTIAAGINTVIEQILDVARWAPSGDNTQPWRFETIDEQHLVVHGYDTRDHCVYDLDGHPSQMALGALLESIKIAASEHALQVEIQRRADAPETNPTFDVYFKPDKQCRLDALLPFIPVRAVQRRPMAARPLKAQEKRRLEEAIAPAYQVLWLDGWKNKLKAANLMFKNAQIRLTMPEAYQVHKSVIEWNARYSEDKIPDKAVGLDPIATRLMKWAMKSWKRVNFFNTYLAGTVLPRIELDWLPGIFCAAHFVLIAEKAPETIDDYVDAGRAMQRFWLTATKLGLQLQPEMTPLIFSKYVREGIKFTEVEKVRAKAEKLAEEFEQLIGEQQSRRAVFIGRVGEGPAIRSRSIRLSLNRLRK